MFDNTEYLELKAKYGGFSSWAIWDKLNESDTTIIDRHIESLNSNSVFLGLNVSSKLINKPWSNFHGGKHDRKIKYACNDTELRGSYITDIFKDLDELHSENVKLKLTPDVLINSINQFNNEMKDIKLTSNSTFVIFGTPNSLIARCFNEYFKQDYRNPIVFHYHYSYYSLTDRQWVEGLWDKLNINADFNNIKSN